MQITPSESSSRGIFMFSTSDDPLLNMKSLVADYGLLINPVPLPTPGEGDVYFETAYHSLLAWFVLIDAAALL